MECAIDNTFSPPSFLWAFHGDIIIQSSADRIR
jgi:hypothetical protein